MINVDQLVFNEACDMAQEILSLKDVNTALLAALTSAREYFDNHSDVVDGDYGESRPNKEMQLVMEIDTALALAAKEGT